MAIVLSVHAIESVLVLGMMPLIVARVGRFVVEFLDKIFDFVDRWVRTFTPVCLEVQSKCNIFRNKPWDGLS